MFQIRVQAPADAMAADEEAKDDEPMPPLYSMRSGLHGATDAEAEEKQAPDALFLTGNPLVRVTRGKLRFFRPDQPYQAPRHDSNDSTGGGGNGNSAPHQQLPRERNTLLCIVTVPSHMAPVELLEFLAGFRADVATVRVLQDPDRSNCMALLQFASQERADQFFLVGDSDARRSVVMMMQLVCSLSLSCLLHTHRRITARTSTQSSRSAAKSCSCAVSSSTPSLTVVRAAAAFLVWATSETLRRKRAATTKRSSRPRSLASSSLRRRPG